MSLYGLTGIYIIINKVNGKAYIGSAKDIGKRFWEHKAQLNGNRHHSSYLQNAWNKYGKESFQFFVIETLDYDRPTIRKALEEEYILFYMSADKKYGYNMTEKAIVNSQDQAERIARKLKGHTVSEVTRKKISEANKGNIPSEATRRARSKAMKGRKPSQATLDGSKKFREENPEWSDYSKKPYSFTSPDGVVHEGIGLKNFAIERGLDPRAMWCVHTQRKRSHQGWIKTGGKTSGRLTYELVSPNGEEFIVYGDDIKEFAEKYNLDSRALWAVMKGDITNHKGWYKKGTTKLKRVCNQLIKFRSPDGVVYEATNIAAFAREWNLEGRNMNSVAKGLRKSHKGWTKAE